MVVHRCQPKSNFRINWDWAVLPTVKQHDMLKEGDPFLVRENNAVAVSGGDSSAPVQEIARLWRPRKTEESVNRTSTHHLGAMALWHVGGQKCEICQLIETAFPRIGSHPANQFASCHGVTEYLLGRCERRDVSETRMQHFLLVV
jgi:hypothetical protein